MNSILHRIFPFLGWLPDVNKTTLKKDLIAGLTGAVIVLPQGVAFAMIAGLPPIMGLYTAMITPIVAALFGSSKHLISGPTTAISIVVFSALKDHAPPGSPEFISLALTITFITGMMQWLMGMVRFGSLINFVSHTVIIGFTAGAALIIGSKQLQHIFGVQVPKGANLIETITAISSHVDGINWYVFIIAISTLVIAIILKAINKKIPHMLIAMVIGSLISFWFGGELRGISLVGEMPGELPGFVVPKFTWSLFSELAPDAFAIALLGLIEAVAIARSIGVQSNQRINGDQEFIGQGLSNIVGSFFNCYAGSGSFTRSGVNYQSGAATPIAAIFAAILLMLIVLFVAPLTAHLPIAAMGGIILVVAYNLIDFKHIKEILVTSRRESIVLITTFMATLFFDLEFAIYLGVIFSLIFFLRSTSKPRVVILGFLEKDGEYKIVSTIRKKNAAERRDIRIVRIDGPVFFGSVDHVQAKLLKISKSQHKFLVLSCEGVNIIDMAGAEMLTRFSTRLKNEGGGLYLTGLKRPVREYLAKGGYWKEIGVDHIFEEESQAINFILEHHAVSGRSEAPSRSSPPQ